MEAARPAVRREAAGPAVQREPPERREPREPVARIALRCRPCRSRTSPLLRLRLQRRPPNPSCLRCSGRRPSCWRRRRRPSGSRVGVRATPRTSGPTRSRRARCIRAVDPPDEREHEVRIARKRTHHRRPDGDRDFDIGESEPFPDEKSDRQAALRGTQHRATCSPARIPMSFTWNQLKNDTIRKRAVTPSSTFEAVLEVRDVHFADFPFGGRQTDPRNNRCDVRQIQLVRRDSSPHR